MSVKGSPLHDRSTFQKLLSCPGARRQLAEQGPAWVATGVVGGALGSREQQHSPLTGCSGLHNPHLRWLTDPAWVITQP